jgi:hypothetical protein
MEGLPDVPTVGDFVPGYEATSLFSVGAPKATPVAIIDRLNREINAALEDPKLKTRLVDLGGTLLPGSPADFGKLVARCRSPRAARAPRAAMPPRAYLVVVGAGLAGLRDVTRRSPRHRGRRRLEQSVEPSLHHRDLVARRDE